MSNIIADFQDEVKHKVAGVMGTVIAIYEKNGKTYADVRSSEYDRVYYNSPLENWEVIRTKLEIEGTAD